MARKLLPCAATSTFRPARNRLEADGFGVDVKPLENDPELHFSLHATRTMKLIVPDMQDIGRRMTAIAGELRGRYDGWAA